MVSKPRLILFLILPLILMLGCEQRPILVVAIPTDISTLDPYAMFSRIEQSVADHVIQTLTYRNDDMEIEPLLATALNRREDGLTWEVDLRPGVRFHDGTMMNAAAVKYSIDLVNQRNADGQTLGGATVAVPSAEIVRVEVKDSLTVWITTARPKVLLPFYLSQIVIVSPEFYANTSEQQWSRRMVGTGPYLIEEHIRDSHILLRANLDYWGDPPVEDEIMFRVIPEVSTRIAELETGGVHIVAGLPIDQADILEEVPDVDIKTVAGGRRVMIGITTSGGPEPLQDKRVRQALNYAIDFDAINEGLLGGLARRMSHVFNPPYAHEELKPYPYDVQKAKALLAEAGYPDGFELTALVTPVGRWIQDLALAQAVASQLEAIGVTFSGGVQSYEWGNYRQKLLSYDLPGLFMQASGGEFELAPEAADLSITSPSNFYRWEHPVYEALWNELQSTLDSERRKGIGLQMQEIIYEEAPWIFLYIQLDTHGVSKRVDWDPRVDELIHLWDVRLLDM